MNTSRLLLLVLVLAAILPLARAEQTLRIGYQKSGAFLLVKARGGLEKRLAPLGWKVSWHEFSAGVPLLEALGAGSLDLGHSGDAPVVFAQAAGSRIVYVAYSGASPQSVGLIVPVDSPAHSLKDLRGRKVAVGKGSSAHFFLESALQHAGLEPNDILYAYLNPPEARAAFEHGAVDAWAVWDPFLASAEIKSHGRVLATGEGASPFREFYLATTLFAKEHPEIIREVLAELEEVGRTAKKDPDAVAAFLSKELGLDLPTLQKSERRKYRYGARPLTPEIIAEQQGIADLFLSIGLLPRPLAVADIVWTDPSAKPTSH